MNTCRNNACQRPTQLYLCDDCTQQLAVMIDQLPWLLNELDHRIQKLDRIATGTIGRARRPDELNVMDFDAAETARKARKAIHDMVRTINGPGPIPLQCTVTHEFIGPLRPAWRRLPAGYQPTIIELIDWLMRRPAIIARHKRAGHVYRELNRLVGSDEKGGTLVAAINRSNRHFAGPCPTIRGRNHKGEPIECGRVLYADINDRTVVCPACKCDIDVQRNRLKAAVDRDLLTEPKLLEVLADIGENVSRVKFYEWVKAGKLKPRGWIHRGQLVPTRILRGDPRVWSLSKVRALRSDEQAKQPAQQQTQ
ncbi:hypothetical protein A5742_25380 [Mycolicibacterium fortuitum]|uniref:Helix-turn-helix DNA binding domain protein n=1 Tax=Mycolicibacterium fortuitum TaxID=1766 RepID=A0ABD6QNC7_MYCFO|nr:hypothetical protein [Mycolicibacterium fortuitum]OMC46869.1 hypothetical protein A5742_25380 [Mycolicibacterium fortuitum]